MDRKYYSTRLGKTADKLNFQTLLEVFYSSYKRFLRNGYFDEAFGSECVDAGRFEGTLGDEEDIPIKVMRAIGKSNLWPIKDNYLKYSEEDLFDVIEFLHDYISKPLEGQYHSWNDCGMHYSTFTQIPGQIEYREEFNSILRDYKEGYELNENGEILSLPSMGLEHLLEAELVSNDSENINQRIEKAIVKFRKYGSSYEDRRDAIRDLADILEFLRPQMKGVISSTDESDLFNLANNFGIRHHNSKQKNNYDKNIWYSWIFYYYLATIHAVIRLIEKNKGNGKSKTPKK